MKTRQSTGQLLGILGLLLAFLLAGSMPVCASAAAARKTPVTEKKADTQKIVAAAKADQAVVPFFSLKLQQHYFITFAQRFCIVLNEKPRHPDAYPIYLSTYFANIFSKAIAINAP